jgi:hypothetical protein
MIVQVSLAWENIISCFYITLSTGQTRKYHIYTHEWTYIDQISRYNERSAKVFQRCYFTVKFGLCKHTFIQYLIALLHISNFNTIYVIFLKSRCMLFHFMINTKL